MTSSGGGSEVYPSCINCSLLFLGDCSDWELWFLLGKNGWRPPFLRFLFLAHPPVLSSTVRKGYRIQADKERDSMKVLYYVEKELAQFDPARRMRGRCEHLLVSGDLGFIKDLVAKEEMGRVIGFEAVSQQT